MQLELLSPAKNYEQGREAINHGADAVYIGAPAYGARTAAGNSIEDIELLSRYAHIYHAKVFATVNTLLFDNEIDDAVKMLHQLYNSGVDAAIIQDMGLLECDLPPIELHASTQTHNACLERIQFLEQVGFSRIILARETSLQQMAEIRKHTHADLEAFIQGALCVSYSGQCYMSQYLNGRSGNRGCCSQPCRSAYDLYNQQGTCLRQNEHLLSLKDFSAARHIQEMADAGIRSFKIEGRLKDVSYVKNVTAYYRQLLDNLMEGTSYKPASSGHCKFYFIPDLEKTFNRGFTDYFLSKRKPMATLNTQKSMGKRLGKVSRIEKGSITLDTKETLTPGDGLCFFKPQGGLEGFLINRVEQRKIFPNRMPDGISVGTMVWRNNDQTFERQLQGISSSRKITVDMLLSETPDGLQLELTDCNDCKASAYINCAKEPAQNPDKADDHIKKQLSKLGDTVFQVGHIVTTLSHPYFLPAATLNQLRREATAALEKVRITLHMQQRHHCPTLEERRMNTIPYFETKLDYHANILNEKSYQFYLRHGVQQAEQGVEKTLDYNGKSLMTTRYCLRFELGCCLKKKIDDWNASNPDAYKGPLYLRNNQNWFALHFDCHNCQMTITPCTSPTKTHTKQECTDPTGKNET